MYNEIEGNLITLAKEGKFDVIAHGCNCFCTMGAGIAPQMAKAFGVDNYPLEREWNRGNINKLGQIESKAVFLYKNSGHIYTEVTSTHDQLENHWKYVERKEASVLNVVNAYTQYDFSSRGKPFDDDAFILCMRKINHIFKGKHIGLPQIGAGLAGGNWKVIKNYIQQELIDVDVTVVIFKP